MKNSYEKIPMRTCLNENFGSIGEELIPNQFLVIPDRAICDSY